MFFASKGNRLKSAIVTLSLNVFLFQIGCSTEWIDKSPFAQKVIIENVGQFNQHENFLNNHIEYVASFDELNILFTKEGLTYRYDKLVKIDGNTRNELAANVEEEQSSSKINTLFIHIDWVGANPNVEIIKEDKLSFYYTYANLEEESGKTGFKTYAYKK